MINVKLREIRTLVNSKRKSIANRIYLNHINRNTLENEKIEICLFCGADQNLTAEHVLPKWAFANCPKKFFNTDVNGQKQTYINATLPACQTCNNNLLSQLEMHIIDILKNVSNLSQEGKQDIIRWLEIIEYKFQVLDVRKKFVASKESGYIEYLKDFPISVLRESIGFSPTKVMKQIRNSMLRITVKSKRNRENSLVVFKSKNESFDFFHSIEEFIFLGIPEFKVAVFYFFSKDFTNNKTAYQESLKIIEQYYKS